MLILFLILYILASLCFFLYALGKPVGSVHLLGLGVFFWSLVPLIQTLQKLN